MTAALNSSSIRRCTIPESKLSPDRLRIGDDGEVSDSRAHRQGPGRPAGVDSLDTRQRVIDAACRCFAQYGYGPATNNLIAEMAGVTAGSVYYHFGTKRNLFAAVCDDVYGKIIGRSVAEDIGRAVGPGPAARGADGVDADQP